MNFAINLDSDLGAKANADADALQRLHDALKAEQKALGGMEKQMRALQRASVVDIETHRALQAAITGQRDKIAKLTTEQISQGRAALDAGDAMREQAKSAGILDIAIGGMLAGAFWKLAGAVKAALGDAWKFAEARGDTERMLETVFRSQQAAQHTYDVIANISKRIAISQERAMQVADSLAAAGMVNGDKMVASIEAVGKAEAARKGAGQVIEGIITRAQRSRWFSVSREELLKSGLTFKDLATTIAKKTGQGVQEATLALRVGRVGLKAGLEALNETIDKRLGAIAQKKFLTIGYQATRLRETFGNLFASVDMTRIAAIMDRVSTWLDTSSVGGATLKEIFESAINGLADVIEAVWPYAQMFFDFLVLAGLKVYNGLYPIRQMLKDTFGDGVDIKTFEDALLSLADYALPVVLGLLGGIALKMAAIAASTIVATWPWLLLGAAILSVGYAIKSAMDVDWEFLGQSIVDGIVMPVVNGVGQFVDAMKNMAKRGLKAFKDFFGIASPARVMMVQGAHLMSGLEQGIAANSNGPTEALVESAGVPSGVREKIAQAEGFSVTTNNSRSTGGNTVTFAAGSIVINLPSGSSSAAEQLRAEMPGIMADVFEQLGFTMGAEAVA